MNDELLEGSIECYLRTTRGGSAVVKPLLHHPQDCCSEALAALMHMVNTATSNSRSSETLDPLLQLRWQQECRNSMVAFPTSRPKSEPQHPRIQHFMAMVTFAGSTLLSNETILVWNVQKEQPRIVKDNREERELFSSSHEYRLQSTLAASGGMHRRLDHQVRFLNNNNNDTSRTRCIDIPMYFPAGIFVNIEDLLRTKITLGSNNNHNNNNNNNVVIQLREPFPIIDQEEPSFVSRPFGLVVHLCLNNSVATTTTTTTTKDETNDDDDDVVSFAMELHSRYPKPCEKTNLLVDDQRGYTMVRWRLYDKVVLEYNHVACPNGDDYPAVVVLSVIVSLLGAWRTLRNIAAVSQWV